LAVAPQVLLLDEPLSALDAQVRVQLREEIRRIQLELGITTVFVTHDQAEALSVADRVGVLRAGRLEQIAGPDELYERPATAFVAEFVGTMNRLPARLADGGVELLGTRRPVTGAAPASGPVVALIRPESLLVQAEASGAGRVVTRTFSGASTRLLVALPDGTEVRVDVASAVSQDLTPGTAVTVRPAERPVLVAPAEPV
jgi:putative spermidine/putrescine transport system ATP-binding protein